MGEQNKFDFLAGGSEMAKRMREFDFSHTPYCPVSDGIGTANDITGRKSAGEALRFQADILQIMDDAVIAFDPCQHITYWNPGAQKMYGWTEEEALGKTPDDIFRPLQYDTETLQDKEARQAAFKKGEIVQGENIQRRKDGLEFWVEYHSKALFDSNGILTGFITILRDITGRKRAEEALRESEQKYQELMKFSPVGIYEVDLRIQRFLSVNDTMCRLSGYDREELLAMNILDLLNDQSKNVFKEKQIRWLNGEYPEPFAEFKVVRKDGHVIDALLNMSFIFDENGRPIGATVIAQDVTKRKRDEEALRESEVNLKEELAGTKILQRISTEMLLGDDDHAIYEKLLDTAVEIMHSEFASIQMLVDDGDGKKKLYLLAHRGFSDEAAEFWKWVYVSSGSTCGEALRSRRRILIPDVEDCDFMRGTEDQTTYLKTGIHGCQTTPLMSRNGKMVGMMSTHWRGPYEATERQLRFFDVLSRQAADFIERRKNEEALREADERLRTMADAAPVLIWETDTTGVVFVNHHYLDFFGVDFDAVREMGWASFLHPEDAEGYIAVYQEAFSRREPYKYECRFRRADGQYRWLLNRGLPLGDDRFVGSSSDITEHKRAEEELKVLGESLATEVNTLNIFHRINTGFIKEADASTVYREILDAAIILTAADCANMQMIADDGMTLEIIAHKGYSNEFVRRCSRISGMKTICSQAMEERSRIIVEDVSRCTIFDEENRQFMVSEGIVSVQSTPMLSVTGELLGMMSTHYKSPHRFSERELRVLDLLSRQAADVIERVRIEEALRENGSHARELVTELEKADRNKNLFISVLSHELRNPLAAILAGIQVLELTQDIGYTREVKEIINRQTKQLCKLVDDLLELTRISQNKMKLKKENIDLNEIVKGAAGDIRFAYEKKGIKLKTNIQAKPVKVNADSVRITQAIGNILFNALKFTDVSGTVLITLMEEKNDAVISVKDNGIGISEEILAHLFTPFTQADTSLDRKGGGLGLGLSIVKGIVDLHEGSVIAYSEGLGKGATFTIRLPITAVDHLLMESLASDNNGKKSLKLLIIEDNKDFAVLLSTMLSAIGYHVDIAYDGIEGVKLAKQIMPDVIFCDIGLPGMNGYDVAESIRNDNGIKDTYLIALTGYAGEGDAERILKAGFDKHLAKPVDFKTLKTVLSKEQKKEIYLSEGCILKPI